MINRHHYSYVQYISRKVGWTTYPILYITGKVSLAMQDHGVITFCSPLTGQEVNISTVWEKGI